MSIQDLQRIRGIGPKYAETLAAAGIDDLAKLAASTPEQLEEIIQARGKLARYDDWIAQARELTADQQRQEIRAELQELTAQLRELSEQLKQLETSRRALSLTDKLSKLPGVGALTDVKAMLQDTPPQEFLNPETWKGVLFVVNHELKNSVGGLKTRFLGEEGEEKSWEDDDDWDDDWGDDWES